MHFYSIKKKSLKILASSKRDSNPIDGHEIPRQELQGTSTTSLTWKWPGQ